MEYKIFSKHPHKGYIVVERSGATTEFNSIDEAMQYIKEKENDR